MRRTLLSLMPSMSTIHYCIPSSFIIRVRERLSTHSLAMVNWPRLHKMKIVERSLNIRIAAKLRRTPA